MPKYAGIRTDATFTHCKWPVCGVNASRARVTGAGDGTRSTHRPVSFLWVSSLSSTTVLGLYHAVSVFDQPSGHGCPCHSIGHQDPGTAYLAGTKMTLLDQALQRGYTAASGVQLNPAYVPQQATAASKAYTGESGIAAYSIDRCDQTAVPASREAPIQIIVANK